MRVGTATRDVTPSPGSAMSGFAARTRSASGVHDPLLVRALVVDDTAVVTVDVVGLHEDTCAEIRRRCPLPDESVVVHATHTHGGPVSMPGRLGAPLDEQWLDGVVDACLDALGEALATRTSVRLRAGYGRAPGVGRNRRRPDGPVDDVLPVLRWELPDGSVMASVVSYACHPVVLGADNTCFTADFPGVARRRVEEVTGAPALFLTGCAGDVNTGHAAQDSVSTAAAASRTFVECERVGGRLADAALAAELLPQDGAVTAASVEVPLRFRRPADDDIHADRARWQRDRSSVDAAQQALLDAWISWADDQLSRDASGPVWYDASVSVLWWGGVTVVTLPGEPFAAAAGAVRRLAEQVRPGTVTVIAGYSNGCPGYLPTRAEYERGGYEVADAHRYYGAPGPFVAGSLELLLQRAADLLTTGRSGPPVRR